MCTYSRRHVVDARRSERADSTCAQTTFLPARCATAVVWSLGEDRISPLAAARAVLLTPDAGRTTSLLCARAHPYAPSSSRMLVRAHAPNPPSPSRLPAGRGRSHSESHGEALCSAFHALLWIPRPVAPHAPPPPFTFPPASTPSSRRGKVPQWAGCPRRQGGIGARCTRGQPSDGSRRHLRALT